MSDLILHTVSRVLNCGRAGLTISLSTSDRQTLSSSYSNQENKNKGRDTERRKKKRGAADIEEERTEKRERENKICFLPSVDPDSIIYKKVRKDLPTFSHWLGSLS